MNNYLEWLKQSARLEAAAAEIGPEAAPALLPLPSVAGDAPVALLCSPHPDDEVITGALALRLRLEGWRVVNLAITLGSLESRRAARQGELAACCELLGFDWELAGEGGLESVHPSTRTSDPGLWAKQVTVLKETFQRWQAAVVFYPHGEDHHQTHIGTFRLVRDALQQLEPAYCPWRVETEFWRPMADPNLLVGVTPELLAHLLHALRQHDGEVARNPYHLRLPAWMADNVRRGSEVIGGAGAEGVAFPFATLYRLRRGEGIPPSCLLDPAAAATPLFSHSDNACDDSRS